ncbi:hypothetical protein AB0B57_03815 [Micromonospora sp. NPDC049101]|uniref:hypothetical protein n=1 Tax=Micromonospora sp. NPDC049101 TaxID=3155032 RepID=UPI0033E3081D
MTSVQPSLRPVLDDPGTAVVLVTVVKGRNQQHQQELADSAIRHWQSAAVRDAEGPAQAPRSRPVALSVFVSGDGHEVLAYARYAGDSPPPAGPAAQGAGGPQWWTRGTDEPISIPFRPYRVVRGSAEDGATPPESFPVAFFTMDEQTSAQSWVDGMLRGEEEREGTDRDYPGAIAAHLQVSLDGQRVLSFSEWRSEAQAAAHIADVWAPFLERLGATGALYRHYRTVAA